MPDLTAHFVDEAHSVAEDAIDAALESAFIGDDIDPPDDFWERSGSDLLNPDEDG